MKGELFFLEATTGKKGVPFIDNHSIRSHLPAAGLSETGGEITSVPPALIHRPRVSFVLPVQFSPLTE